MDDEILQSQEQSAVEYTDDNIRHLSDMEHVRTRPGMYIGRLGDGSLPEDGIYVLLKEVIDNAVVIEKDGKENVVNLDYVVRMREYPVGKNGKRKSIVID